MTSSDGHSTGHAVPPHHKPDNGARTVAMTTMMLWRRARRSSSRDRDETERRRTRRHAIMMPVPAPVSVLVPGPCPCPCSYPDSHSNSQDGSRADRAYRSMSVLWNGVGGVADDFRLSCPGAPGCPILDSDVGSGWLGSCASCAGSG